MNGQLRTDFKSLLNGAVSLYGKHRCFAATPAEREALALSREMVIRFVAVLDLLQHEQDRVTQQPPVLCAVAGDGYHQREVPHAG